MNGEKLAGLVGSPRDRTRNKRKDDAIRRKVESEMTKRVKKPTTPKKKSTVSSLKPAQAIIIIESAKIVQAAQLMAAKRTDAVLVVNESGSLVGILTDKDIAYRVVAEGLDIRSTSVAAVMTKDPIAVHDSGSRNEALSIMVSRRFRHLPVICDESEEDGNVVGLLDITKCVFERLDDLEKKVTEDANIIMAMETLERRGTASSEHVGLVRLQHGCPDIGYVLAKMNLDSAGQQIIPEVSVKASVKEAAKVMKSHHSTAVLALSDNDSVSGIFTTKDIVLRVLAASLDPATTSVIRVMTPHPDSVASTTSILDALKKLHVIDDSAPVGLVDVMTLTISMLTYLWNSTFAPPTGDAESEHGSQQSGPNPSTIASSVRPTESQVTESIIEPVRDVFAFKLRDMTNPKEKVYRFTAKTNSIKSLLDDICVRTGSKIAFSDSNSVFTTSGIKTKVSYLDDEEDVLHLESDKDLEESVLLARRCGWTRVLLFLGEPPKEVIAPTPVPILKSKSVQEKEMPLVQVGLIAGLVLVVSLVLFKLVK